MSIDSPTRRDVFAIAASLGIGTLPFQRAIAQQTDDSKKLTEEMIENAEYIAGITLTKDDRKSLLSALNQTRRGFVATRNVEIGYGVPPALVFQPKIDGPMPPATHGKLTFKADADAEKPKDEADIAFASVRQLAALIKGEKLTSVELTKLYLKRLKKYDPKLLCVVNLTEDVALKQAAQVDEEIAAGKYRGPLHGIPWGAKDLIAYPGYKTTWGAGHYKEQNLGDEKATVAKLLEEAGAVLVVKLTLGALALGDEWYGGMTRNPWDVEQGSSGSSAGPASAVAAGLVGFAIGSETYGSIVSPSTRCGVTGLRPTFGHVSRAGCMTLSWSMDKLGPMARSVDDCALILDAIHGLDKQDPASVTQPFDWPSDTPLSQLKVGYLKSRGKIDDQPELVTLKKLGVELLPIEMPKRFPLNSLLTILDVESGTAFDDITREGITEGLGRWPRTFQKARFIPAIEYLRANRIRTLLMQEMVPVFDKVDLYVNGNDLLITNLTGHPMICVPNGFYERRGVKRPKAITFTGKLYGETELLAVASAYQKETGFHLERPPMDKLIKENIEK